MRDIKFRAWDEDKKEMFYTSPESHAQEFARLQLLSGSWGMYDSTHEELFTHDHDNLMQYTGLKDKNGVEIYEGDVLRYRDDENAKVVEVVWKPEYARFDMVSGSWSEYLWAINWPMSTTEAIGNVYENPELLEAMQ